MRIGIVLLDQTDTGRDLGNRLQASLRRAIAATVEVLPVGWAPTESERPDIVLALIASVSAAELPAWLVEAADIPLIGVWTGQEVREDLASASPRWNDIVHHTDRARLVRAIRREFLSSMAEQGLRDDRTMLRRVIDLVPHFTFSYNRDGRLKIANQALARAFGRTVTTIEGRTIAEFHPVAEEAARITARARDVFEGGQPVSDGAVQFTYADGSVHFLDLNLLPIPGDNATVLGVAVDVTAQRQADSEIRQAVDDLHRLVSATVESLGTSVEQRDP